MQVHEHSSELAKLGVPEYPPEFLPNDLALMKTIDATIAVAMIELSNAASAAADGDKPTDIADRVAKGLLLQRQTLFSSILRARGALH